MSNDPAPILLILIAIVTLVFGIITFSKHVASYSESVRYCNGIGEKYVDYYHEKVDVGRKVKVQVHVCQSADGKITAYKGWKK